MRLPQDEPGLLLDSEAPSPALESQQAGGLALAPGSWGQALPGSPGPLDASGHRALLLFLLVGAETAELLPGQPQLWALACCRETPLFSLRLPELGMAASSQPGSRALTGHKAGGRALQAARGAAGSIPHLAPGLPLPHPET